MVVVVCTRFYDGENAHKLCICLVTCMFELSCCIDVFLLPQNCLGVVYTAFVENMQVQLETLVGNILGCVQVPPPGRQNVFWCIM